MQIVGINRISRTLNKVHPEKVKFDPTNVEHIEAFRMLCLGKQNPEGILIRQHPTLRFELEPNFLDVRSMMFHRVGEFHHNQFLRR